MAAYLIPNTYYLHRQWIHWLFPVFSHVHDALPDLAFHPLEADSPYMTHHPNDNTDVLNCVYTLPPTITNVCRDPTYRTRTAFFAVLGQIAPDGLVFDHSPAPRLTHPDHMVTSLAFWVEARPDPVSEREWQLTLNALNSLVDLVDRPVDTSRLFEVSAGGRVRIRVHGANWRTATYPGFPLTDAEGDRILMPYPSSIPHQAAIRVVFRLECEDLDGQFSIHAPIAFIALA